MGRFDPRRAMTDHDLVADCAALDRPHRRTPKGKTVREAPSLVTQSCPSHPHDVGTHECLAGEMRCAYCGVRLAPYPCNGCGRFLTANQMHEAEHGGTWRCEECD